MRLRADCNCTPSPTYERSKRFGVFTHLTFLDFTPLLGTPGVVTACKGTLPQAPKCANDHHYQNITKYNFLFITLGNTIHLHLFETENDAKIQPMLKHNQTFVLINSHDTDALTSTNCVRWDVDYILHPKMPLTSYELVDRPYPTSWKFSKLYHAF